MSKIAVTAFIMMVLAQWWVPGNMIREKQQVLAKGNPFKFLTEPVDPSHPFKGKYIALSFKADTFSANREHVYDNGQQVYVRLATDDSGYARIVNLSASKPTSEINYIKAVVSYVTSEGGQLIHIQYPFDEYYMDEYKAPKAEMLYRESNSNNKNTTYALVKVYRGNAAVEDVYINGVPLRKLINR